MSQEPLLFAHPVITSRFVSQEDQLTPAAPINNVLYFAGVKLQTCAVRGYNINMYQSSLTADEKKLT